MKTTLLRTFGASLLAATTCVTPVFSKDEPQSPLQTEAPSIDAVLQRLEKLERELIQLKQQKGQAVEPQLAKVAVVATDIRFDAQYLGGAEPLRVLSAKVMLFNLTSKTIEVPADLYTLSVNGAELKSGIPQNLVQRSFYDGQQSVSYANLKTQPLKIEPGETGQTAVVFSGIGSGQSSFKPLVLTVRGTDGQIGRIDLLDQAARQAQINIERIGPRKSLAVVTVNGQLMGLGSWALVAKLEELATDKVARVIVKFGENVAQPDPNVWSWLQNSAMYAGVSEYQNQNFPTVPTSVAEFHVVAPQSQRANVQAQQSVPANNRIRIINGVAQSFPVATRNQNRHVHMSFDDAVTEALASIYQVLPRQELLEEISDGPQPTRVAALANGGGRLTAEDLPLILKLANDDKIEIQKAALRALRHFGEDTAIAMLTEQARKNSGVVTDVAIESLAASRFTKAHDALLDLLKNEPKASRKAIVQSLGQHARPLWSETLYGFVTDKESGVRSEALIALQTIGHPKLVEVLDDCLKDQDKQLSDLAFGYLATREDAQSEQIAIAWTLKYLEKNSPTVQMRDLLIRTKEQRAVPLLLKQLDRPGQQRLMCFETLSQIGDQTVIERFVAVFDKADSNEKRVVLQALQRLQAPEFRTVAEKALATSDYNLMFQAISILQQDGTPQSAAILIAAFKQGSSDDNRFMQLANALGNLATPEARLALKEVAQSLGTSNNNRTNAVRQALSNIQLRSPARQHVMVGRQFEQQKQLGEAMKNFEQAVKADPENAEARIARGNLLLKQEKLEKAAEDFRKAIELDPMNSQGPTNLAIILAQQGKLDEAEKLVEDAREKFKRENLFLYNAACVYGRALEYTKAHEDVPKRDDKLKTFETRAIADIKAAIEVGLDDENRNWAKEDPDLKSLHSNAEFKQLILGQK